MKSRLANVITTFDTATGDIFFEVVLWYNEFDITVRLDPKAAKPILIELEQLALDKIKASLNETE